MRAVVFVLVSVLVTACTATPPPATPTPSRDVVVPTNVANGRVEVVVKRDYAVGETVLATVRLLPTSGSLRGPVDPYVQASGFSGTATVRRLTVAAVSASATAPASAEISWDQRDDAGKIVPSDDYSLVFTVIDDAGRVTTIGATLEVR